MVPTDFSDIQSVSFAGRHGILHVPEVDLIGREARQSGWYDSEGVDLCLALCRTVEDAIGVFTFLDVGANVGTYTIPVARRVSGRVVAFEPHPFTAELLRRSVAENNLGGKVDLRQIAIADVSGPLGLSAIPHFHGYPNLGGVHISNQVGAVQVSSSTLDQLALRDVGFLKIDVEGFELRVLQGARHLLERQRPIILLEVIDAHLRRSGACARDAIEFLWDYGFAPFDISKGNVVAVARNAPFFVSVLQGCLKRARLILPMRYARRPRYGTTIQRRIVKPIERICDAVLRARVAISP